MKFTLIPTKYTGPMDLSKIPLDTLPEKLGMVTTAQFAGKIDEVRSFLEQHNKQTFMDKMKQANEGQLLGCDQGAAIKIQDYVDAFLYIGSGNFHPLGVKMKTNKPVFCFNPVSGEFWEQSQEAVDKYHKDKKVNYMKFLSAQKIGILVSTKPGQYSFQKAQDLKKKLETEGKEAFIFVFDQLDSRELENFPFIEYWINTACPRIADDPDKSKIVDMAELDL